MKIDNSPFQEIKKPTEQPAPTGARTTAQPVSPEPEEKPEKNGDVVHLSERAERTRLMARATELAGSAPEIRTDKVEGLKASINAGTYNVSGQVVAESLIRKSITEV